MGNYFGCFTIKVEDESYLGLPSVKRSIESIKRKLEATSQKAPDHILIKDV